MKTRINLYLQEFRPPKEMLTLGKVIVVSLILLCCVFALFSYKNGQFKKLQKEVAELNKRTESLQSQIEETSIAISQRTGNDAAKQNLKNVKNLYHSKVALLDAVKNLKFGLNYNYSSILMDIAKFSSPNISFNEIYINNDIMNLKGKTIKASEVPALIERFKMSDSLSQSSFETLSIGEDNLKDDNLNKSGLLDFSLVGYDKNKEQNQKQDQQKNDNLIESDDDLGDELDDDTENNGENYNE